MKLRFWGVRGSFATPGPSYLRYGGNTTAVEITNDDGARLLIDLGTGVTELAKELMATSFGVGQGELPILLTHTHIDHIQGLPFFTPFFVKGNRIRILGAEPGELSLSDTLQNQLDGHYSPLYGLQNLAAGVSVEAVQPGSSLPVVGFEVTCAALPHGSTTVLGYRIATDGKSIAFLTDVEYPDETPTDQAVTLADHVDLLIHDAMYSDDDYVRHRGWGHSSIGHALDAAHKAQAKRLALFHHNPEATDDDIDRMVDDASYRCDVEVFAAAEGAPLAI